MTVFRSGLSSVRATGKATARTATAAANNGRIDHLPFLHDKGIGNVADTLSSPAGLRPRYEKKREPSIVSPRCQRPDRFFQLRDNRVNSLAWDWRQSGQMP